MKKIITIIFVCCIYLHANAQIITTAEFFVDTDPGIGNGVPIAVSPTGASVNFTASIPTNLLSSGFHFVGIRAKDNAGKWGLFENKGFFISSSTSNVSNIAAAEFFIDTDPGVGNATSISPSPSGANPTFVASIPTTSLTAGFHFVAIRIKDANGKWGLFENKGFFISSSTSNVSNIAAAEFFIDTDPGVGNATSISPSPTGANPTFVASIPTTSLTAGFHFVAIRIKDANGKWGLFENKGFFISSSTSNVSNIAAAEFFIDTDPGVGNATSISPSPTGANPTFVASIPTTSLTAGFHFVAIRTKDVSGKWGMFENKGFFISSSTNNVSNIVAAEFFIDTDPGVGNATNIAPSPSGTNPTFVASIPTSSLTAGFHFVVIRTKDANGKWGLFENKGFYISTQTANVSVITSGEYFFDTDPGVGNATAFTFTTPGNTVIQNFNLATSPSITPGVHKLALRTKDANGKWGLFEVASDITIAGPVPLNLLSFTGRKEKDVVKLNWQTENEINTHHFEVQRSADGFSFTSIGTVAAFNTIGQHRYIFDDANPLKQISFYRLKQVDINGSFTYSNIVKINVDDIKFQLRLYPNPTANKLMIDWNGSGKNIIIKIMDGKGALIETKNVSASNLVTVNVSTLAIGMYYIELSDGEIVKRSSFIKQ